MNSIFTKIKQNWKSGLTVALVSIPLAVSLAVASQTSPGIGIITAVWAGLMTSIFGGSNYNVIGPTAALSGLLAYQSITQGAASLSMIAIVAGIFILIAYFFKLDKYLIFIPGSVLHGFILGVSAIIIFGQLNSAFGIVSKGKYERLIDNIIDTFTHLNLISLETTLVFAVALILLFAFARFLPKIPGIIVVAPLGIIFGYLCSNGTIPITLQTLGSKFGNITASLFALPKFYFTVSMITPGFTIAVIAILETLISAKIADTMTKTKHDKNREVFGLALGNIMSGIAGGIPATAALARTSLNVKSGCTDKISATISSISIAIISILLLGYFIYIPMSVIAAILIFTSIRMLESEHFIKMYNVEKKNFYLSMIVALVTVYEDPIIGILLGTAITMVLFMERLSKGRYELISAQTYLGEKITPESALYSQTLVYSIKGNLAYINAQSHIAYFERDLSQYKNIVIKLKDLDYIDLDGLEALNEIIESLQVKNKRVIITGVNSFISNVLQESSIIKKLQEKGLIYKNASEALKFLETVGQIQ